MKKRLLSGIILLVLTLALSVGAAFAALFTGTESGSGVVGVQTPSGIIYEISNPSLLFGIAYNEKYNDYAAVTQVPGNGGEVGDGTTEGGEATTEQTAQKNRIVLRFTADIALNRDIVINRDVDIDLNGHTLDLNGHSLTVRHAYYGQFALYSSAKNEADEAVNGSIISSKNGGTLSVQLPNAQILIDESVSCDSSLINTVSALKEVALEYIKNVFASGGAGKYYTEESHLPYVWRYGIHELDVNYTVTDGAVMVAFEDNGTSGTPTEIAKVTSATDAAKFWLDDIMSQYLTEGENGEEYVIYNPVSLPVSNEYLGLNFEYTVSEGDQQYASFETTTDENGNITKIVLTPDIPAGTDEVLFTLTVNPNALTSYKITAKDDSYRRDIAKDIITAILTRQEVDEEDNGVTDESGNPVYTTTKGIILTAIYQSGDMEQASSYSWADVDGTYYNLDTAPEEIFLNGVGNYADGATAASLGLDSIEYTFIDGDPANVYTLEGSTVKFYDNGSTIINDEQIFKNLETTTAALEVTLTIDGAPVTMYIMIGFSWSSDETITGEAGTGSPSDRFGAYFNRIQTEINAATDNLYYNEDFDMRANFDGYYPYIAYRLEKVEASQGTDGKVVYTPITDDGLLTVKFNGTPYSFAGTVLSPYYNGNSETPLGDELSTEDATHNFAVDYSKLPMCGAYYNIYVHYRFANQAQWSQASGYFTLFLPGIVQVDRRYAADGSFDDTNGTVYFISDETDQSGNTFYNYVLNKVSPGKTYIQVDDLDKNVALYLHTSDTFNATVQPPRPGFTTNSQGDYICNGEICYKGAIASYNWLSLLPNITVLDLTGRKFGDNQLSLLEGLDSLRELYIGGYEDDDSDEDDEINTALTSLENLPASPYLPALQLLDISYSQVELFDQVTKENYPALQQFYCGGIEITLFEWWIIHITDWRVGSNGTQNRDTLATLVSQGVSVNNGGNFAEGNPIEKALAQIITQEYIMVDAAPIPQVGYQVADDNGATKNVTLNSYVDYSGRVGTDGRLPQLYYVDGEPISAADSAALNSLVASVNAVITQFPNDNRAIENNIGQGGSAALSYGLPLLSTVYIDNWGREGTRTYRPLIGMQLDNIAYDESKNIQTITIRISYYTAAQRRNDDGSVDDGAPIVIEREEYFVQHEMKVVYRYLDDNQIQQNPEYQDIVKKFKDIANQFLVDYSEDYEFIKDDGTPWELGDYNNALNNISQIIPILRSFSDNYDVIAGLYNSLAADCSHKPVNDENISADEMFNVLIDHFNDWYIGLIDETVDKFTSSEEYQAVFGYTDENNVWHDGYIKRNDRYNMALGYFTVDIPFVGSIDRLYVTNGFWIESNENVGELTVDNFRNPGNYSFTQEADELITLLSNYNSLFDAVKIRLESNTYGGSSKGSQEYGLAGLRLNRENGDDLGEEKSVYNWLVYLYEEITTDVVALDGTGVWGDSGGITSAQIEGSDGIQPPTYPTNAYGQLSPVGQEGMLTIDEINELIFNTPETIDQQTFTKLTATLEAMNSTDVITLGDMAYVRLYMLYVQGQLSVDTADNNAIVVEIIWNTDKVVALDRAYSAFLKLTAEQVGALGNLTLTGGVTKTPQEVFNALLTSLTGYVNSYIQGLSGSLSVDNNGVTVNIDWTEANVAAFNTAYTAYTLLSENNVEVGSLTIGNVTLTAEDVFGSLNADYNEYNDTVQLNAYVQEMGAYLDLYMIDGNPDISVYFVWTDQSVVELNSAIETYNALQGNNINGVTYTDVPGLNADGTQTTIPNVTMTAAEVLSALIASAEDAGYTVTQIT